MSTYLFCLALLRLESIVFIVYYFFTDIPAPGSNINALNLMFTLVPFSLLLTLTIILWFAARPLANHMTSDMADQAKTSGPDLPAISAVAFAVVGVLIVVPALGELSNLLLTYFTAKQMPDTMQLLGVRWNASMLEVSIKLLLGLWLTFGSKPIAHMISKTRHFAIPKAAAENEQP